MQRNIELPPRELQIASHGDLDFSNKVDSTDQLAITRLQRRKQAGDARKNRCFPVDRAERRPVAGWTELVKHALGLSPSGLRPPKMIHDGVAHHAVKPRDHALAASESNTPRQDARKSLLQNVVRVRFAADSQGEKAAKGRMLGDENIDRVGGGGTRAGPSHWGHGALPSVHLNLTFPPPFIPQLLFLR